MSTYQFRSIMAVLFLIASNGAISVSVGLLCTTAFLGFALGAIWAAGESGKGKANG